MNRDEEITNIFCDIMAMMQGTATVRMVQAEDYASVIATFYCQNGAPLNVDYAFNAIKERVGTRATLKLSAEADNSGKIQAKITASIRVPMVN